MHTVDLQFFASKDALGNSGTECIWKMVKLCDSLCTSSHVWLAQKALRFDQLIREEIHVNTSCSDQRSARVNRVSTRGASVILRVNSCKFSKELLSHKKSNLEQGELAYLWITLLWIPLSKFRRVTPRGAQPSARLSEEICLSEGSAGVYPRALRGLSEGSVGSLRGSAGVHGIFRG